MIGKNIIGEKFGRLNIISQVPSIEGKRRWLCKCDCGKEIISFTNILTSGRTKSCGCYRREVTATRATKHGQGRHGLQTRVYRSWFAMKYRCSNPNDSHYKYYGGRGISFCERWNDFSNFLEDMGHPENDSLQLERVNNDLGYSKENCIWATSKTNGRNRSITVRVGGVSLASIAEKHGIEYQRLYHQVIVRKNDLTESIARLSTS